MKSMKGDIIGVFFPTVERCLTITNIPMAIGLVEMRTFLAKNV